MEECFSYVCIKFQSLHYLWFDVHYILSSLT